MRPSPAGRSLVAFALGALFVTVLGCDGSVDLHTPCVLPSNLACAAGSWCEVGTCADQSTTSCYCPADGSGRLQCDRTCGAPDGGLRDSVVGGGKTLACALPNLSLCPVGALCLTDTCANGSKVACRCESTGELMCNGCSVPEDGAFGPACALPDGTWIDVDKQAQVGACSDGRPIICSCSPLGIRCNVPC